MRRLLPPGIIFSRPIKSEKMIETGDFNGEICEGKNKSSIRCQFCSSLILKPNTAHYAQQEYNLPLMHQKNTKSVDEIEKEVLNNFWSVDDMFIFENVGFSNTVQNVKFLICADCEMGPVGYHDIASKKSYIALKRIKHDSAYLQCALPSCGTSQMAFKNHPVSFL